MVAPHRQDSEQLITCAAYVPCYALSIVHSLFFSDDDGIVYKYYQLHCTLFLLAAINVLLTLVLDSRCSGFVLAVSTVQFLLFLFGSAWYYTILTVFAEYTSSSAHGHGHRVPGWLCHQNVFLAFFTCLFSNNYVFSISDIFGISILFWPGFQKIYRCTCPACCLVCACVCVCVCVCVCMRACVLLAGCSNVELCTTAQAAAF